MRVILQPKYSPLLDTNEILPEPSCVHFISAQGIVYLQQGLVAIVEIVGPSLLMCVPDTTQWPIMITSYIYVG